MNSTSNTPQNAVKLESPFIQAVKMAAGMLADKQIQDARNKALCICLQYIGDNGDCPIHGKAPERQGDDQ